MRILVAYDSRFGNTARIAQAIGEGLGSPEEVVVARVEQLDARAVEGVDALVVGGPTQAWRPSGKVQAFLDWLGKVACQTGTPAAAFDTAMSGPLTGSAARRTEAKLRRLGCRVCTAAQQFRVVGFKGPLAPGEEERAREWGRALREVLDSGAAER